MHGAGWRAQRSNTHSPLDGLLRYAILNGIILYSCIRVIVVVVMGAQMDGTMDLPFHWVKEYVCLHRLREGSIPVEFALVSPDVHTLYHRSSNLCMTPGEVCAEHCHYHSYALQGTQREVGGYVRVYYRNCSRVLIR